MKNESQPADEWLRQARQRLKPVSDTPALDADLLLAHILNTTRSHLITHDNLLLNASQREKADALLEQRQTGAPLPYLLGEWDFYGLTFRVTPDVLIPRPETELLVEMGLAWLKDHPQAVDALDAGTGTGCIGISLAANHPSLHVWGTDLSPAALAIARENAQHHHLQERVRFIHADLFPPSPQTFSLIVANLPYIPSARLPQLPVSAHEPLSALDGGMDGLRVIVRLLDEAPRRLSTPGLLLAEIDVSHASAALEHARACFPQAESAIHRDLAGRERVLRVQTGREN